MNLTHSWVMNVGCIGEPFVIRQADAEPQHVLALLPPVGFQFLDHGRRYCDCSRSS
jgi:hypothetical protein